MQPKQTGMIFAESLVPSLLSGKKVQTRRPVAGRVIDRLEGFDWLRDQEGSKQLVLAKSPYGKAGDFIYGRETYLPDPPCDHEAWSDEDSIHFYSGWSGCGSKVRELPKRLQKPEFVIYRATWEHDKKGLIWHPSIHMPKWASRIWLEITRVRVELLQDITVQDALKEGIDHKTWQCPRHEYFQLWDSLYGGTPKEAGLNPLVYVYDFKLVESPIAAAR